MTRRARTVAAIIAGGRATRMGGRDKSRLPVGGQSILDRQGAVLAAVADAIMIIANEPGRFSDRAWTVVPDRYAGTGVTGAILTALEAARDDGAAIVVTVGGDMPFLSAPLLAHLADIPAHAAARWAVSVRGPEPLLAAWRVDAAPAIRAAIDAGRLRAGALDAALVIDPVDPATLARFGDPARLVANINTPDDLAAWQDPAV